MDKASADAHDCATAFRLSVNEAAAKTLALSCAYAPGAKASSARIKAAARRLRRVDKLFLAA